MQSSTPRAPALFIYNADAFDENDEQWLELFQAAFCNQSHIVVVGRSDNLEHMREFIRRGAADYLLKPLKPNELIFRCEKVLSNALGIPVEILPTTVDGVSLRGLTFKERQLLAIFILNLDRSVTRTELFGTIWKDINVNKKTLDVHFFNLRRKLQPVGFDIMCQAQIYRLVSRAKIS